MPAAKVKEGKICCLWSGGPLGETSGQRLIVETWGNYTYGRDSFYFLYSDIVNMAIENERMHFFSYNECIDCSVLFIANIVILIVNINRALILL